MTASAGIGSAATTRMCIPSLGLPEILDNRGEVEYSGRRDIGRRDAGSFYEMGRRR